MIRHSRLTALGILLSLLVALFAVEAKIAWFSPAGSANAQISSAKASPAEPSKGLFLRAAWPAPPARDFTETATLAAAVFLLAVASTLVVRFASPRLRVSASPAFSASLYFRPPPIL